MSRILIKGSVPTRDTVIAQTPVLTKRDKRQESKTYLFLYIRRSKTFYSFSIEISPSKTSLLQNRPLDLKLFLIFYKDFTNEINLLKFTRLFELSNEDFNS